MDPERTPDRSPSRDDDRPVDVDLAPVAEPDAEIAVAYAAWRLDRTGGER